MSWIQPTCGPIKPIPINAGGSTNISAENDTDTSSDSDDLDNPRQRPLKKKIASNKPNPDTIRSSLPSASFTDTRASNTTQSSTPQSSTPQSNQIDLMKPAAVKPNTKELTSSKFRTGTSASKDVSERLAKRKAEREEAKKKAKADEVEIPTFMF